MIKRVKTILASQLGIDKTIGYTLISRITQAGGSVISLLLIAKFISPEEQGYYYTFGSILALQIFFELGFNGIITQYAAHEAANITEYERNSDQNELYSLSRLSSLLHFVIKWFSLLSFILLIFLIILGLYFFSSFNTGANVEWKLPWLILALSASITFIITPLFSLIQGIGKMKEIAKIYLVQQIVSYFCLWVGLFFGFKLFAVGLAGIISQTSGLIIFILSYKTILKNIWDKLDQYRINYKIEIFPYQWKIALSWISGYFIFQLFNPILFATEGAVIAGKMGMTLAAFNGISGISISWITTKIPVFSKHFAKKNFITADALFNATLKQVLGVNAACIISFIVLVFIINSLEIKLSERFLSLPLIIFLGVSFFLNQLVFGWATYLRCHKKEPYLYPSIVTSFLVSISSFFLGNAYGVYGLVIGYLFVILIMKFWEYSIFVNFKKNNHV